jgi:hypothetical protein
LDRSRLFLFNFHGKDAVLINDEVFFAVNLDFGARILAEDHDVAFLDGNRSAFTVFQKFAGTDGDNYAFLRFLFGGVGKNDATGRFSALPLVASPEPDFLTDAPSSQSPPSIWDLAVRSLALETCEC